MNENALVYALIVRQETARRQPLRLRSRESIFSPNLLESTVGNVHTDTESRAAGLRA
jgi:hypothetical protein